MNKTTYIICSFLFLYMKKVEKVPSRITFKSPQYIDLINREMLFIQQELLKYSIEQSGEVDLLETDMYKDKSVLYTNDMLPSNNALDESHENADVCIALCYQDDDNFDLPPSLLRYVKNAYANNQILDTMTSESMRAGYDFYKKLKRATQGYVPYFALIALMGVFYDFSQWKTCYVDMWQLKGKSDMQPNHGWTNAPEGICGLKTWDNKYFVLETLKDVLNPPIKDFRKKVYNEGSTDFDPYIPNSSTKVAKHLRDCDDETWVYITAIYILNLTQYSYKEHILYVEDKCKTCYSAFLSMYNDSDNYYLNPTLKNVTNVMNQYKLANAENEQYLAVQRDHFATSLYISLMFIKYIKHIKKYPEDINYLPTKVI